MDRCPRRSRSVVLNSSELEGPSHYFELRTTVGAGNDLAFLDVVFLKIKVAFTFGTNKLVPVRKSAGNPSCHDYFSGGGTHSEYTREETRGYSVWVALDSCLAHNLLITHML